MQAFHDLPMFDNFHYLRTFRGRAVAWTALLGLPISSQSANTQTHGHRHRPGARAAPSLHARAAERPRGIPARRTRAGRRSTAHAVACGPRAGVEDAWLIACTGAPPAAQARRLGLFQRRPLQRAQDAARGSRRDRPLRPDPAPGPVSPRLSQGFGLHPANRRLLG